MTSGFGQEEPVWRIGRIGALRLPMRGVRCVVTVIWVSIAKMHDRNAICERNPPDKVRNIRPRRPSGMWNSDSINRQIAFPETDRIIEPL